MTDHLGAQGTVIGGGRYDGLIGAMGGPETPAVGWAAGIERLAMLVEAQPVERVAIVAVAEDVTSRMKLRSNLPDSCVERVFQARRLSPGNASGNVLR